MEQFSTAVEDLGTAEGTMAAPQSIKSECAPCVLAHTLKSNVSVKEKQAIEEVKNYLQEQIVLFNENLLDYHRENEAIMEVLEYRKKCLGEIQDAEKAITKTREKLEKSKPEAQAKLQAELSTVSSHVSFIYFTHSIIVAHGKKSFANTLPFFFLHLHVCIYLL